MNINESFSTSSELVPGGKLGRSWCCSQNPWDHIWRFAMGMVIALRDDVAWPRRRRIRARAGGFLRWPIFTMSAGARMRRRWAGGRIVGKATGKPPKLNDAQRPALARIVQSGPILAVHGVVRWCWKDLASDIRRVWRLA